MTFIPISPETALRKRGLFLGIAILGFVAIAGFGAWYLTNPAAIPPGSPEPITVGIMHYEYSGLVFIALHQGFFAGQGLDVTRLDYISTIATVEGLEGNDSDIAVFPEYSIVTEAFQGMPLVAFGNVDRSQSVYLISRRDLGIENITNLKGARIGLSRGTIGEFYLGRFLSLKGIGGDEVYLVNLPSSQYIDAIANGTVDSAVVVYTFIEQAKERLGGNLVVWPIQSSQPGYAVLATRNDWAVTHPGTIRKFLEAIREAEEYTADHPGEAQAIIQREMGYTGETMAALWPDHQYALTLDQSLVLAMEDEARWMMASNLTTAMAVPDFRQYIYTSGLEAVKPGSVNIIG